MVEIPKGCGKKDNSGVEVVIKNGASYNGPQRVGYYIPWLNVLRASLTCGSPDELFWRFLCKDCATKAGYLW